MRSRGEDSTAGAHSRGPSEHDDAYLLVFNARLSRSVSGHRVSERSAMLKDAISAAHRQARQVTHDRLRCELGAVLALTVLKPLRLQEQWIMRVWTATCKREMYQTCGSLAGSPQMAGNIGRSAGPTDWAPNQTLKRLYSPWFCPAYHIPSTSSTPDRPHCTLPSIRREYRCFLVSCFLQFCQHLQGMAVPLATPHFISHTCLLPKSRSQDCHCVCIR